MAKKARRHGMTDALGRPILRLEKFDARELMEIAVKVMRGSIGEGRDDGKETPAVGAVIYFPDGRYETAFRSELRDGDHAEFTLLERKNRDRRLDDAILFATLEPCAPGARSKHKTNCAERIVNARIKDVWVGIEDPDPTVDRKGIKYLQDHGVTVHMFERDLQEQIREANKQFLAQALERKAAAEAEEGKAVTLSKLENPVSTADLSDFSPGVLDEYRAVAKIAEDDGTGVFQRRLAQQGLLRAEGEKWVPAGFGMLLFGKSPRDVMPQAGLLGTIHYPDGTEEVRDFDGPILLAPEQAIQWLKDKLPNPIDRSEAHRTDAMEKFYGLVREGIVNGLVHRNYDIAGAKCQLIVTPDTITIQSPGGPIEPISLEQLKAFNAPMLSRNPVLHYVFAKMKLAEERGLGVKSLKSRALEIGLPLPSYRMDGPYLVLTLYRTPESATESLDDEIRERLNASELKGFQWLAKQDTVSRRQYQMAMKVGPRAGGLQLKKFIELGIAERTGSGKATMYRAKQ